MNIAIKDEKSLTNDSWDDWVLLNVERNCSRREMLDMLVEHGFDESDAIEKIACAQRALTGHSICEDDEIAQRPIDIPTAQRQEVEGVEIYTIENFLDAEECARLIVLMRQNLQRSTVTSQERTFSVLAIRRKATPHQISTKSHLRGPDTLVHGHGTSSAMTMKTFCE